MEVCETCEVHEVHAAVEVVAQKTVVLSPILGQRSARSRRVIAQLKILTIATVTVASVSKQLNRANKKLKTHNGDPRVYVFCEVRSK